MNGLSKTGIEYGEFGWNFYPGCLHKQQGKCPLPNCWAEGMSKRKREDFHKPHLIPERLLAPLSRKKPARILVNFMGDLMGNWVDPLQVVSYYSDKPVKMPPPANRADNIREVDGHLNAAVFDVMKLCPQHQFFFLTKNPAGYAKWGEWPDNAWLGATVCNQEMLEKNASALCKSEGGRGWLSIEPLYERIDIRKWLRGWNNAGTTFEDGNGVERYDIDHAPVNPVDWVVIGGQTNPVKMPEIAWVREIVEACDAAEVKVWLKENLWTMFEAAKNPHDAIPDWAMMKLKGDERIKVLRQELPMKGIKEIKNKK